MLPIYFLTALSSLLLLVFSLQLFLVNTGNRYLNRLLALFLFSRFTENLVYVLILSGKFAFFPISLKLHREQIFLAQNMSEIFKLR